MRQRFWVRGTDEGRYLELIEEGSRVRVRSDDAEHTVDIRMKLGEPFLHLLLDGRSLACTYRVDGTHVLLGYRGREFRFEVLSERRKRIRDLGIATGGTVRSKNIFAPIPGLVVEIEVEEGDAVVEGQGIVIMEAMKMENELQAVGAGIVRSIRVERGTPVDQGQLLVEIE